jgi:hypothetical protein
MDPRPLFQQEPEPSATRCSRTTTHGGNGFCRRHQNHRVHNGREWVQVDARPHGELPFDPSSSAFCRALTRRRVHA